MSNIEGAKYFYRRNLKRKDESLSGPGSSRKSTKQVMEFLKRLIVNGTVRSITDLGCGDLNWMKQILSLFPHVRYTGIDCVQELIDRHKVAHKDNKNHVFICDDILSKEIPKSDLVICRDVLFHMTFENGIKVLKNVSRSRSKLFLTTTYPELAQNRQVEFKEHKSWGFRTINLLKPPYNLNHKIFETFQEPNCSIGKLKRYMICFELGKTSKIKPEVVSKIPKKVHFIWVGKKPLIEPYKSCIEGWKKLLVGWDVRVWTNKDITKENFRNASLIHRVEKPAQKADLMRVEIVQRHGGFYIDADFKPLKSLDEFLKIVPTKTTFVCACDILDSQVCNEFFASVPNHKFLNAIVDKFSTYTYNNNRNDRRNIKFKSILTTTGPKFFNTFIDRSQDTVFDTPRKYFFSFPFKQRSNLKSFKPPPDAIAYHLWCHSWK